jgi:hypothetical protein
LKAGILLNKTTSIRLMRTGRSRGWALGFVLLIACFVQLLTFTILPVYNEDSLWITSFSVNWFLGQSPYDRFYQEGGQVLAHGRLLDLVYGFFVVNLSDYFFTDTIIRMISALIFAIGIISLIFSVKDGKQKSLSDIFIIGITACFFPLLYISHIARPEILGFAIMSILVCILNRCNRLGTKEIFGIGLLLIASLNISLFLNITFCIFLMTYFIFYKEKSLKLGTIFIGLQMIGIGIFLLSNFSIFEHKDLAILNRLTNLSNRDVGTSFHFFVFEMLRTPINASFFLIMVGIIIGTLLGKPDQRVGNFIFLIGFIAIGRYNKYYLTFVIPVLFSQARYFFSDRKFGNIICCFFFICSIFGNVWYYTKVDFNNVPDFREKIASNLSPTDILIGSPQFFVSKPLNFYSLSWFSSVDELLIFLQGLPKGTNIIVVCGKEELEICSRFLERFEFERPHLFSDISIVNMPTMVGGSAVFPYVSPLLKLGFERI